MRGERGERVGDAFDERAAEHLLVTHAKDSQAETLEDARALAVEQTPRWLVVHSTIDLDDEAPRVAVEVDDEAVDHVLPPKLETEASTIAQLMPGDALGCIGSATHVACEDDLRAIDVAPGDQPS